MVAEANLRNLSLYSPGITGIKRICSHRRNWLPPIEKAEWPAGETSAAAMVWRSSSWLSDGMNNSRVEAPGMTQHLTLTGSKIFAAPPPEVSKWPARKASLPFRHASLDYQKNGRKGVQEQGEQGELENQLCFGWSSGGIIDIRGSLY